MPMLKSTKCNAMIHQNATWGGQLHDTYWDAVSTLCYKERDMLQHMETCAL